MTAKTSSLLSKERRRRLCTQANILTFFLGFSCELCLTAIMCTIVVVVLRNYSLGFQFRSISVKHRLQKKPGPNQALGLKSVLFKCLACFLKSPFTLRRVCCSLHIYSVSYHPPKNNKNETE